MSESSQRGKTYELKIAKITASKLKLEIKRDGRSGAGDWHKEDIRDRYGELPISIEVKNQETLKLKEWWRDADDKASVGQAPIVVFPMETEDLAIIRYSDLLNFIKEMFDWRLTAEDLQKPITIAAEPRLEIPTSTIKTPAQAQEYLKNLPKRTEMRQCRNGHILPEGRDKCMAKGCPYSSFYKKPKEKK